MSVTVTVSSRPGCVTVKVLCYLVSPLQHVPPRGARSAFHAHGVTAHGTPRTVDPLALPCARPRRGRRAPGDRDALSSRAALRTPLPPLSPHFSPLGQPAAASRSRAHARASARTLGSPPHPTHGHGGSHTKLLPAPQHASRSGRAL